jgi:hypothetical protein
MRTDQKSVEKAITDAWDFYLSQHPISVHDTIGNAVYEAFKDWLDENKAFVLSILTERTIEEKVRK